MFKEEKFVRQLRDRRFYEPDGSPALQPDLRASGRYEQA